MIHPASYTAENSGYDEKFNAYVKYTKEMIPYQLDNFMAMYDGAGNKYFTCTLSIGPDYNDPVSKKCPYSRIDLASYTDWKISYHLDDSKGFYDELQAKYGVSSDWVKFGDKVINHPCSTANCTSTRYEWNNRPQEADNITIPNPKEIISKSLPGYRALQSTISGFYFEMQLGIMSGVCADVVSVMNMPVSMAVQAVEAMHQVAIVGEEAEKREKEKLILEILTVVFLVIPFVGELLGPELGATMAVLGRIVQLIGAVGNAGIAFYDIAKEPTTAPMEILGMLVGGKGGFGRSSEDMTKMTKLKRGIKDEDLKKIGGKFKKSDDTIKDMMGKAKCNLKI